MLRASVVLAAGLLGAVLCPRSAAAEIAVAREPVYALDGRAIVGANRIIRRTHFVRRGSSSMVEELARATHSNAASTARYKRFFHGRLEAFLRDSGRAGIRPDDAGDARAYFIQVAFKVYDGQGFNDPHAAFSGRGLWGEGAIAGMARASASLARLTFIERIKFLMGANPRFAALSDASKQRVYDFYAIGSALLAEGYVRAVRSRDRRELSFVRREARLQLKADLGRDPDRVRFTASGIEIH